MNVDDIDPDDGDRCWFMNAKCKDERPHMPGGSLELKMTLLKWCQNCLMGKLIAELSRLRLTGLQP